MGDGGEIYATYTPELCEAMGTLVDGADVLMPNLTEASMLTGRTYPGQNIDNAEVNGIIDALLALGAKKTWCSKALTVRMASFATMWHRPLPAHPASKSLRTTSCRS